MEKNTVYGARGREDWFRMQKPRMDNKLFSNWNRVKRLIETLPDLYLAEHMFYRIILFVRNSSA